MKRRRVKITGIGPVTPAGIGREEFWKGILSEKSFIRPYTKLGDENGPFVSAYIDRLDASKYVSKDALPKGAARHTLFAIAGAALAAGDAGISMAELREARSAIITGACLMDFGGILSSADAVRGKGSRMAQPRSLYTTGVGSVPSAINQALNLSARTTALSNQCSSGMDAIGYAAGLVARGEVDVAICGGTDAPLHRFPMVEFRAGDLTPSTTEMPGRIARPFDLWRTTGVIAEGCSMFILEPESSSRRGYSYIHGYGFANDDVELCDGMLHAATIALAQAYLRPDAVDVVSAWAPGHKLVDLGEAKGMRDLFGSRLPEVATSSIKGVIGSPLGAAPAIQVAAAALAQRDGVLPPTVNWEYPDPECPLNLSNRVRAIDHSITLVNSHGLGGVNSAIILERC